MLNRRKRKKPCIHKRICGKSIDERPAKVAARDTFGHWESDTVVGRKLAGEAAVFTIAERLTAAKSACPRQKSINFIKAL